MSAMKLATQSTAVSSAKITRSRVVVAPRAALLTNVKQLTTTKKAPARKAPPAGFDIGFTRENEILLGRLAMTGFASAVVGEYLSSGSGVLAQLSYLTGLQESAIGVFLAGLISFNLLVSLAPNSATYKQQPQEPIAPGPLTDPKITILEPAKFFATTNWGFTEANELFAGRVAQLGMAAAIIGELMTGLGPVGQVSLETGINPLNIFGALGLWAAFMSLTAVDKLAVKGGKKKTTTSA